MPKGMGYRGGQGESGAMPESMNSDMGAYGYSARRMAPPMTPNVQSWNDNGMGPTREASISGPMSGHKGSMGGGGGGDY